MTKEPNGLGNVKGKLGLSGHGRERAGREYVNREHVEQFEGVMLVQESYLEAVQ
jgi:hypothetical protein